MELSDAIIGLILLMLVTLVAFIWAYHRSQKLKDQRHSSQISTISDKLFQENSALRDTMHEFRSMHDDPLSTLMRKRKKDD
jgi:hypothetical protein